MLSWKPAYVKTSARRGKKKHPFGPRHVKCRDRGGGLGLAGGQAALFALVEVEEADGRARDQRGDAEEEPGEGAVEAEPQQFLLVHDPEADDPGQEGQGDVADQLVDPGAILLDGID